MTIIFQLCAWLKKESDESPENETRILLISLLRDEVLKEYAKNELKQLWLWGRRSTRGAFEWTLHFAENVHLALWTQFNNYAMFHS